MLTKTGVVGAGIGGLTAAYILSRNDDVTLFEASNRLGGHADTHYVGPDRIPVDTAFMIFNRAKYPSLERLFGELGVASRPCEMSMSTRCAGCDLAFVGGSPWRGLPAEADGIDPAGWQGLRDEVPALMRACDAAFADEDATLTLRQWLSRAELSPYFAHHVLLPWVACVWSCPTESTLDYPVRYLMAYLDNHGLLAGRPGTRWRTVVGGSARYVERIAQRIPYVLSNTPVRSVRRTTDGVEVRDHADRSYQFDRVVVAVHAPDALRLLPEATEQERRLLGALTYLRNTAVLHTDASVLPPDPRHRASWNVSKTSCAESADPVRMHYDLNRLQRIDGPTKYVVSLNPAAVIAPDSVIDSMVYEHPLYTVESQAACAQLAGLNDTRMAFAGAYHGWSFHEDGCVSAVRAARSFGVTW
jgi:predicted NAD/FAD-binding protein